MGQTFELNVFRKFVPIEAAHYCYQLWDQNSFKFKIVRERNSKLGDYRYDPSEKEHIISVNNDLNPYAFLITYIHEVAHYKTYLRHKNLIKPHGSEWKSNFKKLLSPLIKSKTFPDDIHNALLNHLKNPKAATCSDPKLYSILRKYDETEGLLLSQLGRGEVFKFKNRTFKKEDVKRTRVVCFEIKTGKRYLIPGIALIEKVA